MLGLAQGRHAPAHPRIAAPAPEPAPDRCPSLPPPVQVYCLKMLRDIEAGKSVEEVMGDG